MGMTVIYHCAERCSSTIF